MQCESLFQLIGIHIEAGDDNHILQTIDNFYITLFIDCDYITCMQPAIDNHLLGLCLSLPVALHHLSTPHTEFANTTDVLFNPIFVNHLYLGSRQRDTCSANLFMAGRIHGYHR